MSLSLAIMRRDNIGEHNSNSRCFQSLNTFLGLTLHRQQPEVLMTESVTALENKELSKIGLLLP